MRKSRLLRVLHVAPLPPPLGGMVTYIQGLLNSDVFKSVNYKVVRLNYFNKEKFTGVLRVLLNFLNAFILTAVFLFKTITFNPEIVHIQANSGFGFFEKSWIASHVVVTAGCTIGENCLIAANAVVTHEIPANVIAGGIPARIITQSTPLQ